MTSMWITNRTFTAPDDLAHWAVRRIAFGLKELFISKDDGLAKTDKNNYTNQLLSHVYRP